MKKIIALLMAMFMITGFAYSNKQPQKYATLGSYIYNLVKTSEIEINFIKSPKVSEYFGDIRDSDYYSGAFINAAVSGILNFPQKKVKPWRWINISEAKKLMDRAYMYKTNQKILISNVVFSEFTKMDRYKKVKDNYYLTSQMEKDIFAIYSKKIAEYKKGREEETNDKINLSKEILNDYMVIRLDWGEKPTAGYNLTIAGAREFQDRIEVYYKTTSPAEGQMSAEVITNPKDEIRLRVSDLNKNYKIVAKKVEDEIDENVKYFLKQNGEVLKLTLSIGEKLTGGYSINILEAKQIGEQISVKYDISTPAPGDMVTQVINYPEDSIDVRVSDINKNYNIVLQSASMEQGEIKTSLVRKGDYILVTLDLGEKPTGGYSIRILEAKQIGHSIQVKYVTKSPEPGDIVTQALTYPKDSIMVNVDDPAGDYKVILINQK